MRERERERERAREREREREKEREQTVSANFKKFLILRIVLEVVICHIFSMSAEVHPRGPQSEWAATSQDGGGQPCVHDAHQWQLCHLPAQGVQGQGRDTTVFSFLKCGESTTQHNTTQHNTTQHNTTQHNTTQHNTTQHNTTQHNTTQHNTTQQPLKAKKS